MAKFIIERIAEGEKAWGWEYEGGLSLKIKEEPYTKNEIISILKTLQQSPNYEVNKEERLTTFYAEKGEQQLAWWHMGDNPIEKILSELKSAEITWQNKEDDPSYIADNSMQGNKGTGESGS